MRSYSVAIASLAIDAPLKWTDNAISQHRIEGVLSARRGVARRVTHSALVVLGVTRELHIALGVSVADAVVLAHDIVATGRVSRGAVRIEFDVAALRAHLEQRLSDAMESAPTPRRGRPPAGAK